MNMVVIGQYCSIIHTFFIDSPFKDISIFSKSIQSVINITHSLVSSDCMFSISVAVSQICEANKAGNFMSNIPRQIVQSTAIPSGSIQDEIFIPGLVCEGRSLPPNSPLPIPTINSYYVF